MAISEIELLEDKELKSSTKEDLESLLKLAEELKDKIDFAEKYIEARKSLLLTVTIVALSFSFILFVITYYYYPESNANQSVFPPKPFLYGMLIGIIVSLVYYITHSIRKIQFLNKKSIPDKMALKEVLHLLRETSIITADKENWSVLARAEFRIRLSRFNLEEAEFNFSFF